MSAPAASKNVLVAENGMAVDGIKTNIEAAIVAKRAHMLTVSSERRRSAFIGCIGCIGCCGGMVNYIIAVKW